MKEIQFVECDADLRRRVGEAMGDVAERHVCLDNGFTFVAMDGATPVGLIAIERRRLPAPVPETHGGFVNIIEVAAPYRRQGIARRLVGMSIARCREGGLYQVYGWSSVDKLEAIRMWRVLGFTLCPAIEVHGDQQIKGILFAHRL
jgi:GNAT superfamily N-acetyltransferase